jgi:hypothetical protein
MEPLSDPIADQLKDPTVALACAFVIANRHPEILQLVARTVCGEPQQPKGNGVSPKPARRGRKSNDVVHKAATSDEPSATPTMRSWSRR